MSKSKGNVVTPIDLFDKYGSDAVRYWAASARPGVDTAFSEDQMKVGGKLANKLLNVTRLVLSFEGIDGEGPDAGSRGDINQPIDLAMLERLSQVTADATAAFDELDYARALERTEEFFWWFCDDYVELVKTRAYGVGGEHGVPAMVDVSPEAHSARNALTRAMSVMQRLLAPHMPFCTDEVWSWWHDDSVHRAAWPTITTTSAAHGTTDADLFLDTVCNVLADIRRSKTEAKVSQRAEVSLVVVKTDPARAEIIAQAKVDLVNAGNVTELNIVNGDHLSINVTLAQGS